MDANTAAILDAMGELVVVRGRDRRIIYVNEAVLQAFGGRREDWIDRAMGSIVFEDTATPARGDRWRVTGPLRTLEGPMDVEWEETPLPDGGSVAVGRDVTARLALEGELRHDRAQAEDRARERDAVFAMITHELRTPAAGMTGLADVLASTALNADQVSYVEALRAGGRHLLKLVDDTLDLARLEAGAFDLTPQPTALEPLAAEVLDWMAPQAREKGLELGVWIDPALPRSVEVDGARVRQIMLNLLGNAVKFTPEGGALLGVELVTWDHERARVRVVVEDTGPGVPEDQREAVFQAFKRLDSAADSEGAGLGLAICRRLAEAMGGETGFESPPGGGARFWADFTGRSLDERPVANDETLAALRLAVAAPGRVTRSAVARQLEALGADVTMVSTPSAAQDAGRSRRLVVDARWVDQVSPGRLGAVALNEPGGAGDRTLRPGYDERLVKPARLEALLAAVAPYERSRRAAGPVRHRAGGVDEDAGPARRRGDDEAAFTDPRSWNGRRHDAARESRSAAGWEARAQARSPRSRTVNEGAHPLGDGRRSAEDGPFGGQNDVSHNGQRGVRGRSLTVLLVEDDDVNRFLARAVLTRLGADITEVATGPEALEAAHAQAFDLILMDMRLPGMDGPAVTRELRRSDGPSRGAPILAVTANPLEEDHRSCTDAGMDDVLIKPVSEAALRAAIERWAPPLTREDARRHMASGLDR